ncbi:MAG: hypothetical protein ACR2NV_13080 [Thermoleophilaceae bacterium]
MADRFGPGFNVDERRRSRREESRQRLSRQRRLAVGMLGVGALLVAGVAFAGFDGVGGGGGGAGSTGGGVAAPAASRPKPPPPPELPRGGIEILPRYRVVGFYGAPQADELGVLGIGPPGKVGRKLLRQARDYRRGGKPVMPAFELLATIASGAPGEDGKYRFRQKAAVIDRYLKAARKAKALLVLDIQPGRSDFMDEVRHYRRWLEEPDVSLALDPEWSMKAGQLPGKQIGSTDAAKVNQVSAYLSDLVKRRNLPQKLLIVHQFTEDMITNRAKLKNRPRVALTRNVDGFGDRGIKIEKYKAFTRGKRRTRIGYKLFYKEDTNLMQPRDVLRLRPKPDVVMYE